MKNKYLKFLKSPLTRDILEFNDSELIDKSGNKFPIINGIPRFVDITNYAESFGFQWNIFSEVQLDKKNNYDIVINLAAQAGVRYSVNNPRKYFKSNLDGFFNIINA